jgi:KUP system potassium uptake protein
VPLGESIGVDSLDYTDDGIVYLSARFGFMDEQDIPKALAAAYMLTPELDIDPGTAFYFLSRITIEIGPDHDMPKWQKRIFTGLAQNSGSPAADFCLPAERTLSVATRIEI